MLHFSLIMNIPVTCTLLRLGNGAVSAKRHFSFPPASGATKLPPVGLDTTLTDLFKLSSPRHAHKRLGYIHALTHSAVALAPPFVERNTKFLYQDSCFVTAPRDELTAGNTELCHALAVKYLHIVPQRDAFITGASAAVFFHGSTDGAEVAHDKHEAQATMAVLREAQRPQLLHCLGPSAIPVAELDLIAGYKVVCDGLATGDFPLAIEPEKHWFLNSKAALATSGLPTPRTEIVAVSGFPVPAEGCCDACRAAAEPKHISHDPGMIPAVRADCSGKRIAWLQEQENRIVSAVGARQVPFVFKTQQTFGGGGTWIVETGLKKRELLRSLSKEDGILRKLLPQLNGSNHHLGAGSVLISDFVQDPVGNYGATFFVTDSGGVIFMGVSEQVLASDGKSWVGSTIDYRKQKLLQGKLQPLMDHTAEWLNREHGYYGPVGIDVLETKVSRDTAGSADAKTAMLIVDLNVRTTGSMSLPPFKGHFTSRGLYCASTSTISTEETREAFIEQWRREFLSGEMVILSWYESPKSKSSMGCVIVGAVDEKSLQDTIRKLRERTGEVTM